MVVIADEFKELDAENHSRVSDAVKDAITASFEVDPEKASAQDNQFLKRQIGFFVKEKIDYASLKAASSKKKKSKELEEKELPPNKVDAQQEAAVGELDNKNDISASGATESEIGNFTEAKEHVNQGEENTDINELAEMIGSESDDFSLEKEAKNSAKEKNEESKPESSGDATIEEEGANDRQDNIELDGITELVSVTEPDNEEGNEDSEDYQEGFTAGRAAALSELEEQRQAQLKILETISEKLANDSCFDFSNISKKILNTVKELASERCGELIDSEPDEFLKRIDSQVSKIKNLSEDRKIFMNPEDLEVLKSNQDFVQYFAKINVHADEDLMRGEVIVRVGGAEISDTPFSKVKAE